MAKNSKDKNKGQKEKVVPKKRRPRPRPKPANVSKRGRALAMLSLLLTIIGLITLIELFPRLSASATPPLDLGNQLASSRFTVTNDGYLQVTDVMSACFL